MAVTSQGLLAPFRVDFSTPMTCTCTQLCKLQKVEVGTTRFFVHCKIFFSSTTFSRKDPDSTCQQSGRLWPELSKSVLGADVLIYEHLVIDLLYENRHLG